MMAASRFPWLPPEGGFLQPPRCIPWTFCALFFSGWGIVMVVFQVPPVQGTLAPVLPSGFWQDLFLLGVLAGGVLLILLVGYSPVLLGLGVFFLWLQALYLGFSLSSPGLAPLLQLLGTAVLLSMPKSTQVGGALMLLVTGTFVYAPVPIEATYHYRVGGLGLSGRILQAGPALALHVVARLSVKRELTLEREREKNRQLERTVGILSKANVGFQQYAQNLEVRSRDEERKRITRDLHDTIGYMISAITVMIDAALGFLPDSPGACAGVLEKARNHVDTTHQEARTALHALHSLEGAVAYGVKNIHEIARSFEAATGVKVSVFFSNAARSYGGVIDATLYRFVQEALVNAFRHGKARNIEVALWHHPGELEVYVRDDGTGSDCLEEGIGFLGMRERLSQVRGHLTYETLKSGFRVAARIPLEMQPALAGPEETISQGRAQ